MLKFVLSAVVAMAYSLLTGCATVADAEDARGAGASRVYSLDMPTVWTSMRKIVDSSGLTVVKEERRDGVLLAQRGPHMGGFGENVAIFVNPVPQTRGTRVEVVSRRSVAGYGEAVNWEDDILVALDRSLGQDGEREARRVMPVEPPRGDGPLMHEAQEAWPSAPASTEPVTSDPVALEPVVIEPVVVDPVDQEAMNRDPVAMDPVGDAPVAMEPAVAPRSNGADEGASVQGDASAATGSVFPSASAFKSFVSSIFSSGDSEDTPPKASPPATPETPYASDVFSPDESAPMEQPAPFYDSGSADGSGDAPEASEGKGSVWSPSGLEM